MTIDIIIPAYNAHETLNTAIASIATQKLDKDDSYKVLIVDDASPNGDYLANVAFWSSLMEINQLVLETNGGPGTARQRGVDATDGDFIVFMDADDVLGSPFALRTLSREMKKDYDVVMGTFVEEDPNGHIVQHGENWVWLHGKMFRRRTIERFLLEFNDTRACEDVGYLSVLRNLTDRTVYIPQVTYIWQNRGDSTVRGDREEYAYGKGWRGFIDNMIWSYEELAKRNINKALIRDHSVTCYVRMFNQLQESIKRKPEQKATNLAKIKEFYDKAIRPFVLEGAMPYEIISSKWIEMQKETQLICVPQITMKEYLTFTGYYEDREKAGCY